MLIIHGEHDDKIPPEHAHRLYDAAPGHAVLKIVPDEDHDSLSADRRGVIQQEMTAWFARWLRP